MSTRVELVEDRFPSIIDKMPVVLERDETSIANRVAASAKARAPRVNQVIVYSSWYRTPGWMAESIETDEVIGGGTAVAVGAFIGRFQEFGTEHHRAQPYLVPSLEAEETDAIATVEATLRRL